jgi:hypothetical protein
VDKFVVGQQLDVVVAIVSESKGDEDMILQWGEVAPENKTVG